MPEPIRLNRFLAQAGVASRRGADALIAAGRVAVDGTRVDDLGRRVVAGQKVTVDGRPIGPSEALVHLVLNKPAGVVTTARDPQGRTTVLDLVDRAERIYPVGRLDADTTGLLLLTNDGDLAHRLAHPSRGVEKVYRATVKGRPSAAALERLRRGVRLEDGPTAPARARLVRVGEEASEVELAIHEGRNHQVRRMFEAVGHPCLALRRVAYGPLRLGHLRPGGIRGLTHQELVALRAAAGLT